MAGRIKRPCASPGCAALVEGGYCEKCHRDKPSKLAERTRLSSSVRGYGKRWQAMSAARLNKHPFCADPFKIHSPFPGPATLTDHIVPHKGDMALFWNPKNWQSLCSSCHSRKTALEDGGFGHAMKKMSVTLVCGPPGADGQKGAVKDMIDPIRWYYTMNLAQWWADRSRVKTENGEKPRWRMTNGVVATEIPKTLERDRIRFHQRSTGPGRVVFKSR